MLRDVASIESKQKEVRMNMAVIEPKPYPRGVKALQEEIIKEKTKGKGKQRIKCLQCNAFFHAEKDPEELKGRPRENCSKCRLEKLRKWRRNYDQNR